MKEYTVVTRGENFKEAKIFKKSDIVPGFELKYKNYSWFVKDVIFQDKFSNIINKHNYNWFSGFMSIEEAKFFIIFRKVEFLKKQNQESPLWNTIFKEDCKKLTNIFEDKKHKFPEYLL